MNGADIFINTKIALIIYLLQKLIMALLLQYCLSMLCGSGTKQTLTGSKRMVSNDR